MDVYKTEKINDILKNNSYAGRGIVLGKSANGKFGVAAYFIMGRSNNSRNRIFKREGNGVVIYPIDASKVEDPSLIVYSPVRVYKNNLIVTNGDQTDTVYDFLAKGGCFFKALKTRTFEPDAPNFTPRISGVMDTQSGDYKLCILKSADKEGGACNRFLFDYAATAGVGHFLHTYVCDGNPLPTFVGEPERVSIPDDIDEFTDGIWSNLDADNKISLYVRYVRFSDGAYEDILLNKNK